MPPVVGRRPRAAERRRQEGHRHPSRRVTDGVGGPGRGPSFAELYPQSADDVRPSDPAYRLPGEHRDGQNEAADDGEECPQATPPPVVAHASCIEKEMEISEIVVSKIGSSNWEEIRLAT